MLLTVKPFKILPKHNGCDFISDSFASNEYIFTPLKIEKQFCITTLKSIIIQT